MTDFRALCAELLQELEHANDWDYQQALKDQARAAQWGADQELEACCALLEVSDKNARDFLQSARRPKPPSLKEQALQEMDKLDAMWDVTSIEDKSLDTIRRALEQLPDHE